MTATISDILFFQFFTQVGPQVWVHAGAIDDRGYSFASSTYKAISREEEKFTYGLY